MDLDIPVCTVRNSTLHNNANPRRGECGACRHTRHEPSYNQTEGAAMTARQWLAGKVTYRCQCAVAGRHSP
jgi:hypothetical protein